MISERPLPEVLRPSRTPYIIDHHHVATAPWRANHYACKTEEASVQPCFATSPLSVPSKSFPRYVRDGP
ncbi:hypothetical protein SB861_08785 [Paraburkholderia sp. SIMBA_049]